MGATARALRRRLGLRQSDVADHSGVSQSTVSRLELGDIEHITVGVVRAVLGVLDARLDLDASWRGAGRDRLLDEGHARLCGLVARELTRLGWQVWPEVTFSHFGERGSIDILAWHAASRILSVIEVKTEIGSIEDLSRRLDAKVRLAKGIASERFSLQPVTVARFVVLPDERSCRRLVERHAALMDASFPARTVEVRRWLRDPHGSRFRDLVPDRYPSGEYCAEPIGHPACASAATARRTARPSASTPTGWVADRYLPSIPA